MPQNPNMPAPEQPQPPAVGSTMPVVSTGGISATQGIVVSNHEILQPEAVKKPKGPKFAILFLILVLIIGLAIGGGVAIHQINKPQKTSKAQQAGKPQKTSSASSTAGLIPSNWIPYTSTAGNFSAAFPAAPTVIPQSNITESGVPVTVNTVESNIESDSSNIRYAAGYETYPSNDILPTDTAGLNSDLQQQEDLGQLGGQVQLISSKYITVDGYKAVTYELTITASDDAGTIYVTGEMIPVKNVLYAVTADQIGSSQPTNAQEFINSFKIGQ